MKHNSFQFHLNRHIYLILIAACFSCKKEYDLTPSALPSSSLSKLNPSINLATTSGTLSQTRTANYWFNIGTNEYVQWGVKYIAQDDNSYAYTRKINKVQRIYLIVQDFGFTIPANATILNISAHVKRFKSGLAQTKDCFVHLLTGSDLRNWWPYGVEMANVVEPWPSVETEAIYSQSGNGNNGIDYTTEPFSTIPYQWTPAAINNVAFGFYLLNSFPDKGYYIAYFDQVQINVEYSLP